MTYNPIRRHNQYLRHKDKEKTQHRNWALAHPEARKAINDRCKAKLKRDVLTHYSWEDTLKCVRCEITDIDVLCLDHINGGGNEHRRQIKALGTDTYFWIKRNNFPEGFQVLCFNCNMKKRIREKI